MSVATIRLGDVCEILSGFAWSAAKFNQDRRGVPIIRIQNVDAVSDNDFVYWDESYDERFVVRQSDILLTLSGSFRIESWNGPEGLLNQRIVKITPSSKLDRGWLLHVLRPRLGQIERLGRHALVNNVSLEDIRNLAIPLPPLPEQRRVAEVLDRAEALRAKRRAALAQLDTLTQSIFLDMFGDPIANTRQFPVRRMIDLVDRARPISYGILMPGPDQTEGVKYVRVVDMQGGGIELSGIRKTTEAISNSFRRSLLKSGDLLMSIRGHVGRFAVVPPDLEGANITQDTARLAIVGADPVFVRECLRTEGFQRWMARHTKGVAVRGINLEDVKLMPVIAPDAEEQREFARLAKGADELKASERASAGELDALFASLQHCAFRGEL
jgi:type I restriction enzyme, S subunit